MMQNPWRPEYICVLNFRIGPSFLNETLVAVYSRPGMNVMGQRKGSDGELGT